MKMTENSAVEPEKIAPTTGQLNIMVLGITLKLQRGNSCIVKKFS